MDREDLEKRLKNRQSLHSIANETKRSVTSVRYWVKKYELKIERYSRDIWQEETLRLAVEGAESKREVLRRLGLRDTGSVYTQLAKMAERWNIDLPQNGHAVGVRLGGGKNLTKPEELFQKDRPAAGATIRRHMLASGKFPYVCKECGLDDTWNKKPLVLQVDHIDGDHKNNLMENLRFLCPNCHTQTDTYCRRSK